MSNIRKYLKDHKDYILKIVIPRIFGMTIVLIVLIYNFYSAQVISQCNSLYLKSTIGETIKSSSVTSFRTKCIIRYSDGKRREYTLEELEKLLDSYKLKE